MSKSPYQWVDSHCHFMDDYMSPEELAEAFHSLRSLEFAVYVGTDWKDLPDVVNKIELYENLYGTLGIHPKHIEDFTPESEKWMREQFVKSSKIRALGEIGLDYFRNSISPSEQKVVFEKQLQIAIDIPMPVVIHARESIKDCLEILDNFALKKPIVFHCFTGSLKEAEAILERGFWISFTGVITFPKNDSLYEVVPIVPKDRIMVETDSPFLAPIPHRGKINRPEWVQYVGERVAMLRHWSLEETQSITTTNAYRFFQIPSPV